MNQFWAHVDHYDCLHYSRLLFLGCNDEYISAHLIVASNARQSGPNDPAAITCTAVTCHGEYEPMPKRIFNWLTGNKGVCHVLLALLEDSPSHVRTSAVVEDRCNVDQEE